MNHDELGELIRRIELINLELTQEVESLRTLKRIRESARPRGTRPPEKNYRGTEPLTPNVPLKGSQSSTRTNDTSNKAAEQDTAGTSTTKNTKRDKKKLVVGDRVRVKRGGHKGEIGTIVKVTTSQIEIKADHTSEHFRKWKDLVKRV